jgi:hypothetical protein
MDNNIVTIPEEKQITICTSRIPTDSGYAPNPEKGLMSLAICKPDERKTIKNSYNNGQTVIVIGTGSMNMKQTNGKKTINSGDKTTHIIYIMVVTRILTFAEYYKEFRSRKDCIYKPNGVDINGKIVYKLFDNSYHNEGHTKWDIKHDIVVLSNNFIYFGRESINIINNPISNFFPMGSGRGHRVYSEESSLNRSKRKKLNAGDSINRQLAYAFLMYLKETYPMVVGEPHIIMNILNGCGKKRGTNDCDGKIKSKTKKIKLC